MSHVFLDRRDGGCRLYLGGDLQFDAADERRYHEPLALVPALLAHRRAPRPPLRALILGGGDGLALREVLRAPGVREAHVVDHDPLVLALGRHDLATLNARAFDDPRVMVHVDDALAFLRGARDFDVVIADFTYPRDLAGAKLHTVDAYARVRAAIAPRGVLAVNAVSPDVTPEAFGCIGATLTAVGFAARPCAFALPSFATEGYGRWGVFFASPELITDDEIGALSWPSGVALSAADVIDGASLPAAIVRVMGVGPNRTDELLYHIANAAPLPWEPPFERVVFPMPGAAGGARLTVAEGFSRWLRQPDGRRSLETLLACVPLAQRGPAREWIVEWAHHAEVMFRSVDLRAFAEGALRRAAALPEVWQRELRELARRVRDGMPPMRELLEGTWRVFAVFLLALLLANLLFPDNLYAKGSRSGSSSSGSSESMNFSDPGTRPSPFRARPSYGARGGNWVSDQFGQSYDAAPFVFTDRGTGPVPSLSLLALTKTLRLIDGGGIAYHAPAPFPGYQFVLHPDRLAVTGSGGQPVTALHPGSLVDEAAAALAAQTPLLDRAVEDHRRWMAWARWGSALSAGHRAGAEMEELERLQRSLRAAQTKWGTPLRPSAFNREPDWKPILPGVFFAPDAEGGQFVLVDPDGVPRRHAIHPPPTLTEADRFVFAVLRRHLAAVNPGRPADDIVRAWFEKHGDAVAAPFGRTP